MDVDSRSQRWLSSSITLPYSFETETPIEPGACIFGWPCWPESTRDPLSLAPELQGYPITWIFYVGVGTQKPELLVSIASSYCPSHLSSLQSEGLRTRDHLSHCQSLVSSAACCWIWGTLVLRDLKAPVGTSLHIHSFRFSISNELKIDLWN